MKIDDLSVAQIDDLIEKLQSAKTEKIKTERQAVVLKVVEKHYHYHYHYDLCCNTSFMPSITATYL